MKKVEIADSKVVYGSKVMMLCDWIDTTNLVVIGGRGMAKSTVVMARRSLRCVRLMPGAPLAIVADSYANLENNIMPAVQNGWNLQGLREGIHYVKGIRPPEEWKKRCSVIVDNYKHVYSFWNGSVIFLGSLDKPSLLAGKSVAHLLFDEAKFASDMKAARVMPILRGDAITYGRCHLYGGVTITTDMPDVTEGEFDWFFRYANEMQPERIIKIIQTQHLLNQTYIKLAKEQQKESPRKNKICRLEKDIKYFTEGLLKLRKGQTFFMNISSFANIDILTVDYARRLYEGALEHHEFLKSVMGMKPGLRKDTRFYILFGEEHKYSDGTISGEASFSCRDLKYLNPDKPIDGGMDFGNMLSLVIGQEDGKIYRIHKNFYELPPGWYRELADQFISFFADHRAKQLYLYYDRSGNNYEKQGEDAAGKIKDAIERDANGHRTGWTVHLMSRKQANIPQNAEYNFMYELLGGTNPALPILKVDSLNCPEMISSIERAKKRVKYVGNAKMVAKEKKTEKLPAKKLPKLSTNFSDAYKYLMMRRNWINATRKKQPEAGSSDWVGEWLASRSK